MSCKAYVSRCILGAGVNRLLYFPPVVRYLTNLPDPVRVEVSEALAYLQKFGRAAQLPDVRPIVSVPNLFETRTQLKVGTRRYTIRVLVMSHSKDLLVACVAGDKDAWHRQHPNLDWYETWLPVAEQVYEKMREQIV
jgi:hypothetical protein